MDRISAQAGWIEGRLPETAGTVATGTLAQVLASLDDASLVRTLETLDPAQVHELIPQLPPARSSDRRLRPIGHRRRNCRCFIDPHQGRQRVNHPNAAGKAA